MLLGPHGYYLGPEELLGTLIGEGRLCTTYSGRPFLHFTSPDTFHLLHTTQPLISPYLPHLRIPLTGASYILQPRSYTLHHNAPDLNTIQILRFLHTLHVFVVHIATHRNISYTPVPTLYNTHSPDTTSLTQDTSFDSFTLSTSSFATCRHIVYPTPLFLHFAPHIPRTPHPLHKTQLL